MELKEFHILHRNSAFICDVAAVACTDQCVRRNPERPAVAPCRKHHCFGMKRMNLARCDLHCNDAAAYALIDDQVGNKKFAVEMNSLLYAAFE